MAKKTADRSNKSRFDRHVVDSTLMEGDRVLVRNIRLRGKHKLADRWESNVYVVVKQCGDVPVYVVRPETKDGPIRTLHRDLLLPCGFLPATTVEVETPIKDKTRRPRTRQHPELDPSDCLGGQESDSDDYNPFYLGHHRDITVETQDQNDPLEATNSLAGANEPGFPPAPAAKPDLPDVAEAFPEDTPAMAAGGNLPEKSPAEKSISRMVPTENNSPVMDLPKSDSFDINTETDNLLEVVEAPSPVPALAESGHSFGSSESETNDRPRKSSRHREPVERLTYPELGNPLITVVQSLFQSLSTVITDSLNVPKPQGIITL